MKNTIERALEKQKALEAEKKQSSNAPADNTDANTSVTAPHSSQEKQGPVANHSTQVLNAEPKTAPLKVTPEPDLSIDLAHIEAMGMVTPSEKFTTIKEEYRYIKRPLLNIVAGTDKAKHSNLIMVTSCFPGEGKTFTAINLAMSIANEQDRQVLLIDADVIKPNVCQRLNLDSGIGLLDYLKGEATVQEIIRTTNIPNLRIISAGTKSHHANELLASEKMNALMNELSTRYHDRICVFDTSPILGASETGVLSQMMGQGVIVVEEERTTHGQLERAISLLDPKMSAGLVLNKSKKSRKEYYGYYYASNK